MYSDIKHRAVKTLTITTLAYAIAACGGSGQGSLNTDGVAQSSLNPLGAAAGTNNSGSLNAGGASVGQLNPNNSLNPLGAAVGTFNSGSLNPMGVAGSSGSLNPGGVQVGNSSIEAPSTEEEAPLGDIAAFIQTTEVAASLSQCMQVNVIDDICTFETLPLIGIDTSSDTAIDKIMKRVAVSHTWMGERFEQVLMALPSDMLPLFDALTAIVIDDDVRPAYYSPNNGAIFLDPSYLWFTPEEASTINPKQDFRADFGSELAYISAVRRIKNAERIGNNNDFRNTTTIRNLDDILPGIAALLLHELAHANDFFPQDHLDDIDITQPPNTQNTLAKMNSVSLGLFERTPLTSEVLNSLGQVSYLGNNATDEEKSLTSVQVGNIFEQDGANVNYAYSSIFEDTASLFEEAMLKYFFDIDQDTAYLTKPDTPSMFCDDYIIGWGVRNRIGDINVKDRAQYVVERILPALPNSALFFQDLPAPQSLNVGGDWCSTSLMINASNSSSEQRQIQLINNEIAPR